MQLASNVSWLLPNDDLVSALRVARSLTRADMCVLLLHDESAGAVVPVVADGISGAQLAMVGAHRAGSDAFGVALAERHRVVVRDAWQNQQELASLARSIGFRSVEIIPLIGLDGAAIGLLAMMFRHSRGSSRRTIKVVERCGRLIVLTVQHARRAIEAERARRESEANSRARTQFLARMSHELRTPLQSIIGYLDLLLLDDGAPPTPAQMRMFRRMHQSSEILRHVVDDLITMSRIEAGSVTYDVAPVDAAEAIAAAQEVVAPLAASRQVTVEVIPCEPLFVAADGAKLKQILVNLAANAVKFASTAVRIGCTRETGSDTIVFTVTDDGPGIPADKLETIFQAYVRLDSPVVDRFGGTGLGLTISREFAGGMHGTLSASARPGGGSVFSLRMPLARPKGAGVGAPTDRGTVSRIISH